MLDSLPPPARTSLDWIELMSGSIIDWRAPASGPPDSYGDRSARSARSALAGAVRSALLCQPCVVAFSGGRDSSALLAVAADVARREGLPLPVPVTLRFTDTPLADESSWQELVVRHIGLTDWLRVPITGELDFLGPYARRVLRSHGVLHPSNAHFMSPIIELAAGGAVVTGLFGDQLFDGWRWRAAADARAGRRPTTVRIGAVRAMSHLPIGARYVLEARRDRGAAVAPWLAPEPARRLRERIARARALEPADWAAWVARFNGRRGTQLHQMAYDLLGRDLGARVFHPLADEGFLGALAREGGSDGLGKRTAAMNRLFGDVLPTSVLERASKASFPLAGRETADFVRRWDGSGLPGGLLDGECLRHASTRYGASYLWQYLWLGSEAAAA